jgi:hypothetical protein
MGANAQTAVPAFTAGQVLTAAQMTEVNTGIPVFATTVTRDAAFGGSGEKVLAQGQTCYIEATSTYQTYNGSSWVSLVTSGLVLVKSQVIGTTVAAVTVSDAFSATYDNYVITVNGGVASTNNSLVLTLGATTTGYYYAGNDLAYSSTAYVGLAGQNTANWPNLIRGSANSLSGQISLYDPFAAKNTHFSCVGGRSEAASGVNTLAGYLANTTSYTAFTLTANSGTVTGGTIRVYGYANS